MPKQTVTLSLDPDAVSAIRSGKRKALRVAIEETIKSADQESSDLAGFLQGFCANTRESYMNESLSVDCVEDETLMRGSVCVSFKGDSYIGCQDAEYQHDHTEELEYRVDLATSALHLIGDFSEERSSHEEL